MINYFLNNILIKKNISVLTTIKAADLKKKGQNINLYSYQFNIHNNHAQKAGISSNIPIILIRCFYTDLDLWYNFTIYVSLYFYNLRVALMKLACFVVQIFNIHFYNKWQM